MSLRGHIALGNTVHLSGTTPQTSTVGSKGIGVSGNFIISYFPPLPISSLKFFFFESTALKVLIWLDKLSNFSLNSS